MARAGSNTESVFIQLDAVSKSTVAFVLILNGEVSAFEEVKVVSLYCNGSRKNSFEESLFGDGALFDQIMDHKQKKEGILMGVLYKDGWHAGNPRWNLSIVNKLLSPTQDDDIETVSAETASDVVPSLLKYKSRMFINVRDLCVALSSRALPKLKVKFLRDSRGLQLPAFTEAIFYQLYNTYSELHDLEEASYCVAMIHEMFHQIGEI